MGDVIEILTTATNTVEVEAQGPQGIPGVGVPTGGSALQVLRKKTGTDYDTEWAAAGSGSGSVTSVALASTDLTISGSPITDSGTITANIAANAVTLEKLQTISSQHLLGRHGNGNGGVQQIGLGTGLAMSGSNVRVATTGITAGTYTKLTIDETGRATVGATATPSDIGAQGAMLIDPTVITGETTLTAARAKQYRCASSGTPYAITLPVADNQEGDLIVVRCVGFNGTITVGGSVLLSASGQQVSFRYNNGLWQQISVDYHVHLAADIGGLGSAAGASTSDFAAASHSHELTALAATGATNGHVLTANGSNGATFAALPASGVTGAAASASDVLGVSGANITGVDANADRIVYWNNTSNKLAYGTPADAGAAAASHTHTSADINSQTASNGHVLTANGSGGASFAALPASGISAVGASTADVLSVSGSDLVADDGGLIDSSDPFIKWDDVAGKLVYANPLSRPSGAFHVGLAPTTTAIGARAINIQSGRAAAANVAANADSIAIGNNARTAGTESVAIGLNARSGGQGSVVIGWGADSSTQATSVGWGSYAHGGGCAFGQGANVGGDGGIATGQSAAASSYRAMVVGYAASASGQEAVALGSSANASAQNAVAIGTSVTSSLRGEFATRAFRSVFWGGQTTDATANVELNLDATATNRFTIAANTALIADILLIANSTGAGKALSARRSVAIRRDGSNNTSLIGAVETNGTDQNTGSPTWSFTVDADDTNESLRVRVTGAVGETVNWRAVAFYRVV